MGIPFTIINLDRPRKVRLGYGAMVEFEETTGIKIQDIGNDISITTYMKLLWVMLKQEDETLTFKKMLEIIDEYADNLEDIIGKINQAVVAGSAKTQNPN
jgi:hypothetical protein